MTSIIFMRDTTPLFFEETLDFCVPVGHDGGNADVPAFKEGYGPFQTLQLHTAAASNFI